MAGYACIDIRRIGSWYNQTIIYVYSM